MQIYEWELLRVCHHLGKFCEHRYYDSGEIVVLVCHVISCKNMIKGFCEFIILPNVVAISTVVV